MYQEQSKFELYLELLSQVKQGNNSLAKLRDCTQLSEKVFEKTIAPLIASGLLKKTTEADKPSYRVTSKGEQFIELTKNALQYIEPCPDNYNGISVHDTPKRRTHTKE
jgi:predicted transcriptional regulator